MNRKEFVSHFDEFKDWCQENGGEFDHGQGSEGVLVSPIDTGGSAICEFGNSRLKLRTFESGTGVHTVIENEGNISISKSGPFGEYSIEDVDIDDRGGLNKVGRGASWGEVEEDLIEEITFDGDTMIVKGHDELWTGDDDEFTEYEMRFSPP